MLHFFFTNLGQSSAALCKFSLHQMSCAPFCETVPGSVVHRRFLPVYSLAMSHFLGLLGPHFRSAPIFTWCLDPCKNGGESVLFSPKSNSFISRGGGGLAKYVESMANSWLGLSIARRRRDAVRDLGLFFRRQNLFLSSVTFQQGLSWTSFFAPMILSRSESSWCEYRSSALVLHTDH